MRLWQQLRSEMLSYVEWFVGGLPGATGRAARLAFWRRRLAGIGTDARLGQGLHILGAENVTIGTEFSCWRNCVIAAAADGSIRIGSHVGLNSNVYINAASGGRIVIGDDVGIGPNVVMRAATKSMRLGTPMNRQPNEGLPIQVGNDVWIGANVTIVGGVTVGDGAVIAAGAVVTRDVEPLAVVGGVPARMIRKRGAV